ncbi:MAG TPA: hypothetical protein VMU13_00225 [Candidatus Paceibacterota bacterium]|nr:hypothetical protein [Candidatus Paceibacterota bacterium]
MNHRTFSIGLFITSLILIVLGYFLMYPALTNWCGSFGLNCFSDAWTSGIGEPLFWSTWPLPFLFFGLIFVRREVFGAWWKIALPMTIIGLLIIVASPALSDFLTPGRTQVTELVVNTFVALSLIVIIWKYWRLWRLSKSPRVRPPLF